MAEVIPIKVKQQNLLQNEKVRQLCLQNWETQAILDGRKSLKHIPIIGAERSWAFESLSVDPLMTHVDKDGELGGKQVKGLWATFSWDGLPEFPMVKAPYEVGDILYVREPWRALCSWVKGIRDPRYGYAIKFKDGEELEFYFENAERARKWERYLDEPKDKWQSAFTMPREAARIWLQVTDMRVERLRFITEAEARAEGIHLVKDGWTYKRNAKFDSIWSAREGARHCFRWVWDTVILNKRQQMAMGWKNDPWCWVIKFKRIAKGCDSNG